MSNKDIRLRTFIRACIKGTIKLIKSDIGKFTIQLAFFSYTPLIITILLNNPLPLIIYLIEATYFGYKYWCSKQ